MLLVGEGIEGLGEQSGGVDQTGAEQFEEGGYGTRGDCASEEDDSVGKAAGDVTTVGLHGDFRGVRKRLHWPPAFETQKAALKGLAAANFGAFVRWFLGFLALFFSGLTPRSRGLRRPETPAQGLSRGRPVAWW